MQESIFKNRVVDSVGLFPKPVRVGDEFVPSPIKDHRQPLVRVGKAVAGEHAVAHRAGLPKVIGRIHHALERRAVRMARNLGVLRGKIDQWYAAPDRFAAQIVHEIVCVFATDIIIYFGVADRERKKGFARLSNCGMVADLTSKKTEWFRVAEGSWPLCLNLGNDADG